MGSLPAVGVAGAVFGWPLRTKIETHRKYGRWVWTLNDGHGNQIGRGGSFAKKSDALLAAMNCKRANRKQRISDGV